MFSRVYNLDVPGKISGYEQLRQVGTWDRTKAVFSRVYTLDVPTGIYGFLVCQAYIRVGIPITNRISRVKKGFPSVALLAL